MAKPLAPALQRRQRRKPRARHAAVHPRHQGAISEDISEAEFRKMLNRATRNMMYQGGTAMRMSDCEITDARDRLTGECSGGATHKGEERHLVVFLWIESGGVLVLAAFISVQPTEEIRDTIDHMMRSVGPD